MLWDTRTRMVEPLESSLVQHCQLRFRTKRNRVASFLSLSLSFFFSQISFMCALHLSMDANTGYMRMGGIHSACNIYNNYLWIYWPPDIASATSSPSLPLSIAQLWIIIDWTMTLKQQVIDDHIRTASTGGKRKENSLQKEQSSWINYVTLDGLISVKKMKNEKKWGKK